MSQPEKAGPYVLFMLALSFMSLVVLALHVVVRFDAKTLEILQYADTCVCALFFVDFLITLYTSDDRKQYLLRWGWLDLLSSIPALDSLRWGRAARVMRILRILRGLRSTKVIAQFVLRRRAESAVLAATLVSILLVVISSIAILHLEDDPASNIKTAEDALWWSVATITTVGYGDRYPVTSEGRVIAAILMVAGVGLFGTLSGSIAAWFLRPSAEAKDAETQELLAEIKALRASLTTREPKDAA